MTRFASIREMASAGLYVRIWCIRCARGRELVADQVPARFAALPLSTIARRLRCRICHLSNAILILPASPPGGRADHTEQDIPFDPEYTGKRAMIAFFHTMRAQPKRPPLSSRPIMETLRAGMRNHHPALHVEWIRIDGHMLAARRIALDDSPG